MGTTDLAKLRALEKAATAGPWHSPGLGEVHDDANNWVIVDVCWADCEDLEESVGNGKQEDADFIAALRNAAPALLDCAEALYRLQRAENCWCDMSINHPLTSAHTGACCEARAALARLNVGKPEQNNA